MRIADERCEMYFRLKEQDLYRLFNALRIPARVISGYGSVMTGEEVFLREIFALCHGQKQFMNDDSMILHDLIIS